MRGLRRGELIFLRGENEVYQYTFYDLIFRIFRYFLTKNTMKAISSVQELPSSSSVSSDNNSSNSSNIIDEIKHSSSSSIRRSKVLLMYAILAFAILCTSTGILWFKAQTGTAAVSKASWRLQATILVMLPAMLLELKSLDLKGRLKCRDATFQYGVITGVVLGIHYAFVAYSVQNTSLPHAILSCNCPPLFLVFADILRYMISMLLFKNTTTDFKTLDSERKERMITSAAWWISGLEEGSYIYEDNENNDKNLSVAPLRDQLPFFHPHRSRPPSFVLLLGTFVSFAGISVLVVDTTSSGGSIQEATIVGDLAGLSGSAMMALYFAIGAYARKELKISLFCWLAPVNAIAALVTTLYAVFVESADVFLWLRDGPTFLKALGGGFLAGTIGHGLANYVMTILSPLVVSVAFLIQPFFAILFGYITNLGSAPTLLTLFAAPLLIGGSFLVTVGQRGLSFTDLCSCLVSSK